MKKEQEKSADAEESGNREERTDESRCRSRRGVRTQRKEEQRSADAEGRGEI